MNRFNSSDFSVLAFDCVELCKNKPSHKIWRNENVVVQGERFHLMLASRATREFKLTSTQPHDLLGMNNRNCEREFRGDALALELSVISLTIEFIAISIHCIGAKLTLSSKHN
jgi:ABC-type transport system involved in Fe-S cluster assembly fused permease/ATPase subunit